MERKELDKMMKKYEPTIKKTGKQFSKAMKSAEEDIVKLYKVAQTHVELQMKNLQKEKLYHDIGKAAANKILKGDLEVPGFEKYKKHLEQLSSEGDKIKSKLSRIGKVAKRRAKKSK